MIHPLVLGAGRRLFDGGVDARLRLIEAVATSSGVLMATTSRTGPRRDRVSAGAGGGRPDGGWRVGRGVADERMGFGVRAWGWGCARGTN
jgi:hypothetical protein